VGNIVDAYERWDATQQPSRPGAGPPVRASRGRRQGG
jgi:phosphate starvation-inducible PhoH-like protein